MFNFPQTEIYLGNENKNSEKVSEKKSAAK